jgi:translation initiation factor eIF-2B subunit delta
MNRLYLIDLERVKFSPIDSLKIIIKILTDYYIFDNISDIIKRLKKIKNLGILSIHILQYIEYIVSVKSIKLNSYISSIDNFINDRIIEAHQKIINNISSKLIEYKRNKHILFYGNSLLMDKIIYSLLSKNENTFIYLCGNKNGNSKKTLKKIINAGFRCTYFYLNSLPYMINEITHVFIGANEVLADARIVSDVGTSMISLVSKIYNKPVFVCSETLSFNYQIKNVNFTEIEIKNKNYKRCNLDYDIIPSELISQIITEKGVVSPNTLAITRFFDKFNRFNI